MRLRKRKTTAPLSSKATWLGGNKRKMEKLEIPTKNSLSRPLKASAALATRMAAMVLARSRSRSSSRSTGIGNQPDQGGPDAQVVDPVLSQALTVHADLCQVHHLVRALVILVDRTISANCSQTIKKHYNKAPTQHDDKATTNHHGGPSDYNTLGNWTANGNEPRFFGPHNLLMIEHC